jgi:hypothetical protein
MRELERNPELGEAAILSLVKEVWDYPVDCPTGQYREDAIVSIGDRRFLMRFLTRESLLAWALHESDERNLAYIKSRLDKWDRHPECKTLAELERA